MNRFVVALCLLFACPLVDAAEPARVMIVGTFHFSNPGHDLHDVKAVDVTTPKRQAELQAISDALATFHPTVVAVEWPEDITTPRYAQFLKGTLPASTNEVVQLGFRVARQTGLKQVD
ncbi:MAG TPA: hypothetical protein VK660_09385, partial [Xanthomonadaceae bacterium]|nr:hypothetical protein [Xanthomonadaceae bacterium]